MNTPTTAHRAPEPPFIRILLVTLAVAVIAVAVIANGAAYLGGVNFVHTVMHETRTTAYVFGGVIEISLAVVAGATFVEAYRMQPTAVFRTATWVLSAISGCFGALFEIAQYLTGALTLWEAVSAAGWRIFAPFLAAGLWELVIHLFCGPRHRAHRAAERRNVMLFWFFKAAETEGLVHGTWRAPFAAAAARRAARRISRHVTPDERDAELARHLASAQYAQQVRTQVAAIAATTARSMRQDITAADAPLPVAAPALQVEQQEIPTMQQSQPEQTAPVAAPADHDTDVAAAAIDHEANAAAATRASASTATVLERRAFLRDLIAHRGNLKGREAYQALLAAGYHVSERTAGYDLAAAKAA